MAVARGNAIESIRSILAGAEDRAERARKLAEMIRSFSPYRWVGIYDVGTEQVSNIAWSGPAAPAFPVFPVSKGLTGSAIRERAAVVVGDVRSDPRYLSCLGNTLSEIIIPVLDPKEGRVIGTVDVESERANAFSDHDRRFLERCAQAALPLWTPQ